MSHFEEYVLRKHHEAYLIEDENSKTKKDYIEDAEEGLIVAFRLNFTSKALKKLTKVISGKIMVNDKENKMLEVEARNGLKYGVPYTSVVWVKTGDRWPKGVYNEMKKGSRLADENDFESFNNKDFDNFGELHFGDDNKE